MPMQRFAPNPVFAAPSMPSMPAPESTEAVHPPVANNNLFEEEKKEEVRGGVGGTNTTFDDKHEDSFDFFNQMSHKAGSNNMLSQSHIVEDRN